PCYDLSSKEILRANEIKVIVAKPLGIKSMSGNDFTLSPSEQRDGRRIDMLYIPANNVKKCLAPVIVSLQKKKKKKATRTSLNVMDATELYPHVMVISSDGFSDKRFRDSTFTKEEPRTFYTHPCQALAKSIRICISRSLFPQLDQTPLDKMIALCHIFFRKQKSILILEKYDDLFVQAIYKVALQVCAIQKDNTSKLNEVMQIFCDSVDNQFDKILKQYIYIYIYIWTVLLC
ncbi:hypothetical protein F4703DRAFT_1741202, partial [Phycomyces blakesleeanus]